MEVRHLLGSSENRNTTRNGEKIYAEDQTKNCNITNKFQINIVGSTTRISYTLWFQITAKAFCSPKYRAKKISNTINPNAPSLLSRQVTSRSRGILVYNICLISISNSVSDGATNKSARSY